MTTDLDITKYHSATVHSDSVVIRDEQHGEIALSDAVFERLYQQYLEEQANATFVTEME